MRVLGIVGSPRQGGNTEIMVREALTTAHQAGAETDLFLVSGKNISPCDGCGACEQTGACPIKDDMQELYSKFDWADGIIFGTPVYYANVTAQAKAIIDRTHALRKGRKLGGKVAGAIVVTRRLGASQVRNYLFGYLVNQGMVVVGAGIGYGRKKGDVTEGVGAAAGLSALEEARQLGTNVILMLKRLSPA